MIDNYTLSGDMITGRLLSSMEGYFDSKLFVGIK
jgi:hypothetical protein